MFRKDPSPNGRGWCEAPGEGYRMKLFSRWYPSPGPLARATLSPWERDSPPIDFPRRFATASDAQSPGVSSPAGPPITQSTSRNTFRIRWRSDSSSAEPPPVRTCGRIHFRQRSFQHRSGALDGCRRVYEGVNELEEEQHPSWNRRGGAQRRGGRSDSN
jgi:hypothetical protein